MPQPEQPGRGPAAGAGECGPDAGTGRVDRQRLGGASGVGQQHRDPRAGRGHRRRQLGRHPPGAESALTPLTQAVGRHRHGRQLRRIGDLAHRARGCEPGIAGVERIDVRQQHQRIRPDQMRDKRGKPVVVAEADLGGGHRVVLVDHRDHAELQELGERPLRVAVVRPADHVVAGQQHLADPQLMAGEGRRVLRGELLLADRRRGLLGGQVPRPPAQSQRRQTGGDRARGHQHDMAAGMGPGRHGVHQPVQPRRIQAALGAGQ